MAEADSPEMALALAALLLHDAEAEINAQNLRAVIEAANVDMEAFWYNMFARAIAKADLGDLISSVGKAPTVVAVAPTAAPGGAAAAGAAPAAKEEEKEEEKEESDEDLGFGLFD